MVLTILCAVRYGEGVSEGLRWVPKENLLDPKRKTRGNQLVANPPAMVQYDVQVDDASPIVQYSGEWSTIPPEGASSLFQYHDGTVHSTSANSSSASITFRGTSVAVYGTRSQQAADFFITLDGTAQRVSGFAQFTQYQQSLFSTSNLPLSRLHTLHIERADSGENALALDYFEWTTGLNDNIANTRFAIDDTNTTISYNPADAWTTSSVSSNQTFNHTVRSSSTNGATVSIPFAGNALYLYGPTGAFAQLSVTVDGQNKTAVNCTSSVTQSQTLLFYSDIFLPGEHTLELTVDAMSGNPVAFDYVDVVRWSDNNGLGHDNATVRVAPTIAGTVIGYLSAQTIVGIVFCVVIPLAFIICLGLWYQKRRRRNEEEHQRKIDDAIIIAAHPDGHANTSGNEMSSPGLGEQPKGPPVQPLASERPSEANLIQAPESNSAAHHTNGADANQKEEKSTV